MPTDTVKLGEQSYVNPDRDASSGKQSPEPKSPQRGARTLGALSNAPVKREKTSSPVSVASISSSEAGGVQLPFTLPTDGGDEPEFKALVEGYLGLPHDIRDELELPGVPRGATRAQCLSVISRGIGMMAAEIPRLKQAGVEQANLQLKRLRIELALGALQTDLDNLDRIMQQADEKIEISRSTVKARTDQKRKAQASASTTKARLQSRYDRDVGKEAELKSKKEAIGQESVALEQKAKSAEGQISKLEVEIEAMRDELDRNNGSITVASSQIAHLQKAQAALDEKLLEVTAEAERGAEPDQRSVVELRGRVADVIAAKHAELAVKSDYKEKNRILAVTLQAAEMALDLQHRHLAPVRRQMARVYLERQEAKKEVVADLEMKEALVETRQARVDDLKSRLAELKKGRVPLGRSEMAKQTIESQKRRLAELRAEMADASPSENIL
jgi:chromosome segregation ATPase